jgi:hypothetical protein
VRLRVTDNENDMATTYRSITVTNDTFTVNTPMTTHAVPLSTPYNTEYEFSVSDFENAVTDPDGDPLEKIRVGIRINPATGLAEALKGTLTLNGVEVFDGQEITLEQIPYLAYTPSGNSGEAFFEYNAFDGHAWSPFDTSRVNITIGDPPSSELFINIDPSSGREHATGTLGVNALYFTNEQSAISEVPAYLDGREIIRTHSDDKDLTALNTLSFSLTSDATVYVAYDGRVTSPPNWLTSGWTLHSDDELKSWFYFLLYKKDFLAGETVTLGGNNAPGTVSKKSMYFVIGDPIVANNLPVLSDLLMETDSATALSLERSLFESAFSDADGDSLIGVRIDRLPQNGSLLLGGTAVTLGQVIDAAALDTLTYVSTPDYSGFDNIVWTACDGTDFSASPAKVHLTVVSANTSIPPILNLSASAGGVLLLSWQGYPEIHYVLRSGTDLQSSSTWPVVQEFPGEDGLMSHSVTVDPGPPRFWIIESTMP